MNRKKTFYLLPVFLLLLAAAFYIPETVCVQAGPAAAVSSTWKFEDGKWYYYDKNGEKYTGWYQDPQFDNRWFYLDEEGVMQRGWLKLPEGTYYLRDGGRMAINWVKVDDSWYYMGKSGIMQTGWVTVDGERFFLGENGILVRGWVYSDGYWYFLRLKGAAKSETIQQGNHTFAFDENCHWVMSEGNHE